jgi:hypothetical protein
MLFPGLGDNPGFDVIGMRFDAYHGGSFALASPILT